MKTCPGIAFMVLLLLACGMIYAENDDQAFDYSQVRLLRYMGEKPPGTFEAYMAGRSKAPFSIRRCALPGDMGEETAGGSKALVEKIIVLVNAGIRTAVQTELNRYIADISARGYQVELFETSGGTAADLRTFLQGEALNLVGSVFVGDIIAPWFEVSNDFNSYGYATFPCDLFYMDLDGTWTDADTDGRYDSHSAGTGDEGPEIFVGRIDTSMMTGNEVTLLKNYFDKNHSFWDGSLAHPDHGHTYTEDDWAYISYFLHDIQYAYPSYSYIAAPNTDGDDYIDDRVPNTAYEFVQLSCHSGPTVHGFTRGSWIYSSDVIGAPPHALFFNLFCCSSSRYTETDFLGGAYIYNSGTTSLATIGSSKTGSMLVFSEFYTPLGQGKTFGQAFKEWFDYLAPYDFDELCWHFGMTIAGDPMLVLSRFRNQAPVLASPSVTPGTGYYGTRFEYRVHYYDEEGQAPGLIQVNIDGVDYDMTLDSGTADDGFYRYRTRDIDPGVSHTYYFYAEDGQGGSDRNPDAAEYSGPANYDPELYLLGTPGAGNWMTVEVWGCAGALWGSAWSSENGPYFLPASGLTYEVGPGDLHMAKRIALEPRFLDEYGYGGNDFRIPPATVPGTKYIQATTKMNAFWGKTNWESFVIP